MLAPGTRAILCRAAQLLLLLSSHSGDESRNGLQAIIHRSPPSTLAQRLPRRRRVGSHGMRSQPVPVALAAECSIPVT